MDKKLLSLLDNQYVLVTGATGLIGQGIVKSIINFNLECDANIQIVATGRSIEKLNKFYTEKYKFLHLAELNVDHEVEIDLPIDYIIHGASITSSKDFVDKPVDVIKTLLDGTRNMLQFAANKNIKSFVYLSSLEVYGVPGKFEVRESDYGYIDFTKVRSSYSEGKRMAECICSAYASQYGVPVKTLRLTQTIGSDILYNDGRVFAQFARSVIEKKDIVLNTAGNTVRSYLGINDAVSAIFTVLLCGKNGEAYNAANMETAISIADLARFVCEQNPDSGINVIFNVPDDIESFGYNPEMKINMNTQKLESLGWKAEENLKIIFDNLINGLKEKVGK